MSKNVELPGRLGLTSTSASAHSTTTGELWLERFFLPARLEIRNPARADAILAWGLKPSAQRASNFAARHHLPVVRIEDAFLRSVAFGANEPPLGLVLDDMGVYYDCSKPSRLDTLINRPLATEEGKRASALRDLWREARVSKYNHAREYRAKLPDSFVLAVDQTQGDLSIRHGNADDLSFLRMVEAALDENPGETVILKTHPEVMARTKRGHFDLDFWRLHPRVHLVTEDAHPVRLIEYARRVYTVTSQVGFEALLWGKPVRTFGLPFYAGWGLTADESRPPPHRGQASLEQLIHAALIGYARYVHPETETRCEVEDVVAHLALQRAMIERTPVRIRACGFSHRKQAHVRRFFPYSQVRVARRPHSAAPHETIVLWGRKAKEADLANSRPVLRIEDGFVRSIGLGAKFAPPLSWVVDNRGIYFDATAPSELEEILNSTQFNESMLDRAAHLAATIVARGVTKYNLDGCAWNRTPNLSRVILVPGQVESDASIHYGAAQIRTNLDLLRNVKRANPDAHIIYKPHPDVVAGVRLAGRNEESCKEWCDEVVLHHAMSSLLAQVDEIHTITSLTGFEGLLRSKKVVTYGQPFYAGWGLTIDHAPLKRRRRQLRLEELIAGALIIYPLYISRVTGRYTTPERALVELTTMNHILPESQSPWSERVLRLLANTAFWRQLTAR
jgi:capsular polysaccharide export protein